jgi:voltage-gated potassium channel
MWYVIETISTVGYGDQYPVTNAGRLVGTFIIVVGVGIFGTFTGYLANMFLSGSRKQKTAGTASPQDQMGEKIENLRRLLAEQQTALDEIGSSL